MRMNLICVARVRRFLGIVASLAATLSVAVAADPVEHTVTTAMGAGADAQLTEHNNRAVTSGSGGDFNTRTSSAGDRNEIVALRFDLSEFNLSDLSDVTLNIINFRDNSSRQVALYGVKPGTQGDTGFSTEDWDEASLGTFGAMPGLLPTDSDYVTQSLNTGALTFLGQISFSSLTKGTPETFNDPAISAFIRTLADTKYVTFILAAAPTYTSTGQARFASKEATALDGGSPTGEAGAFAPYLTFKVGTQSNPPSVLITSPVAGADFLSGAAIPIEVSASPENRITKVEFFSVFEDIVEKIGEDTTAPFSFTYIPTAPATYTLRAVATDQSGLTGEHSITVDVGAENPPNVTITAPFDLSTWIAGTKIIIAANITDDVSVAKAEFRAGRTTPLTLLGEDTAAPYTAEFTPEQPGTYTISVIAEDNLGLKTERLVMVEVTPPPANLRRVSTFFGAGLDVQANEHSDSVSGSGGDLNTRTSSGGDRNEIIALRFDLSEYTLAELHNVTLNVINQRVNSARQVALYGVPQGTMGGTGLWSTEDWTEFELLDFGDVPGLLVTDGDYTTQSIDLDKVVPLGQITLANLAKGSIETFNDPAITDFIRGYSGSKLVTFILAAAPGYTSTGQGRFASRDAANLEGGEPAGELGQFAPFLSFEAGGAQTPPLRITGLSRNNDQVTVAWTGGAGPFQVQTRASLTSGSWTDLGAPVNSSSATIPMTGTTGFIRVRSAQ